MEKGVGRRLLVSGDEVTFSFLGFSGMVDWRVTPRYRLLRWMFDLLAYERFMRWCYRSFDSGSLVLVYELPSLLETTIVRTRQSAASPDRIDTTL